MASKPGIQMAFCMLWLLTVGAGFAVFSHYENTRGAAGLTPERWPSGISTALEDKRATLLLFAHPRCPCTRSSLEELNRLMAKCQGLVAAHIWFLRPKAAPDDWDRTDLWRSAVAMRDVTVHEDNDGAQAARFGAQTSGYVLLYDSRGRLLFKGGITDGRGHAGDNAGEDTIVALVTGQSAQMKQTPVYGCSLLDNCKISRAEGVAN